MKYEIQIDPSYWKPKVIILTSVITDDVNQLTKKLMEVSPSVLPGFKKEKNRDSGAGRSFAYLR